MTTTANLRLVGWKTIAAYLRCSVRSARRLASKRLPEELRLPVSRDPAPGSNRVRAYADEVDAWERRTARARRVATNDP